MRIAVIGLRGIPEVQGGIERHCQELCPRISTLAGNVTLIARSGYVRTEPYLYCNVRIKSLWAPKKKGFEALVHTFLALIWLIKNSKDFDIVHFHGIGPSIFTPLARVAGFKIVVTNHGSDYNRKKWGKFAQFFLRFGEYLGSKFAHQLIAVSKTIRENLSQNYSTDCCYIPNGVKINCDVSPGKTLSKFNLSPQKYVLAVGRLVPEKGFHDLMDAFEKVKTDWKLVIVGDADYANEYCRKIKGKAQQSGKIVMTGYQNGDTLKELYSNAGLFVLPSYHEGLPIVALEAMSFKLPMFVSDISANQEVAFPDETFPVGDINALAKRLSDFINNPTYYFRSEIFDIKKKRLLKEYNWDHIATETIKVYRQILLA